MSSGYESAVHRILLLAGFVIIIGLVLLIDWIWQRYQRRQALWRFCWIVTLHIADYITNLSTMCILAAVHDVKYLLALAPVEVGIGAFCLYTAWHSTTSIKTWIRGAPICCNAVFVVVVLGLMQGAQVALAYEDLKRQRSSPREDAEDGESSVMPVMMPARYHCKAMDSLVEGFFFVFVSQYALLKRDWISYNGRSISLWEQDALMVGIWLSLLTAGLGLLEVDHRTSAAVQKDLGPPSSATRPRHFLFRSSTSRQVRHLAFRVSEFALRVFSLLAFVVFARPTHFWWLAFAMLVADYMVGVVLLLCVGGREPLRLLAPLLGLCLFVVNVVQFAHIPGLILQGHRISTVILCVRFLENIGIVAFCVCFPIQVDVASGGRMQMWDFLYQEHYSYLISWIVSALVYYILLVFYACWMRGDADLHTAVKKGDVESLEMLLRGSELVLDVNRYGPAGRTPLHVAAACGNADIIRLLIAERADLHATTTNRQQHTALHLAAFTGQFGALRELCDLSRNDGRLLNAQNGDGETWLHIVARRARKGLRPEAQDALQDLLSRPNLDKQIRNAKGQIAREVFTTDGVWNYDRRLEESLLDLWDRPGPNAASSTAPSGGAIEMTEEEARRHEECEDAYQRVPLMMVGEEQERKFKQKILSKMPRPNPGAPRAAASLPSSVSNGTSNIAVTGGISSFMLCASFSSVSRVIMRNIPDEQDTALGQERSEEDGEFAVQLGDLSFEKKDFIGKGEFGQVWRVQIDGTDYAMKQLTKAKYTSQKIVSKAQSERYLLKTIKHPFIVSLHYAYQTSVDWVLVMDFCSNGDLHNELIRRGDPGLPMYWCARIAGEVLLAVEHLHNNSIIFRDIKLENVLLDANYRARMTDFGFAKKLTSANGARSFCGSWGYMAPEIMGRVPGQTYTTAVDMYAYGVMLYMLVSGGLNSAGQQPSPGEERFVPNGYRNVMMQVRAISVVGDLLTTQRVTPPRGLLAHEAANRPTAIGAKSHNFYTQNLAELLGDGPLDGLLRLDGTFEPPRIHFSPDSLQRLYSAAGFEE